MLMCKNGIAAVVVNENGRIDNIRQVEKDGKSEIQCTFKGRGCSTSRTVNILKVMPANNKAAKALKVELIKLSSKISKNANTGIKFCSA